MSEEYPIKKFKRFASRKDSECMECGTAINEGDSIFGLPPRKSPTDKWVIWCSECMNKHKTDPAGADHMEESFAMMERLLAGEASELGDIASELDAWQEDTSSALAGEKPKVVSPAPKPPKPPKPLKQLIEEAAPWRIQ